MPHDPIERWEWEGGAIAADVRAGDERHHDARGRPADSADRRDERSLREPRIGSSFPEVADARPLREGSVSRTII